MLSHYIPHIDKLDPVKQIIQNLKVNVYALDQKIEKMSIDELEQRTYLYV
jgi:hypothetical protein